MPASWLYERNVIVRSVWLSVLYSYCHRQVYCYHFVSLMLPAFAITDAGGAFFLRIAAGVLGIHD